MLSKLSIFQPSYNIVHLMREKIKMLDLRFKGEHSLSTVKTLYLDSR